MTQTLCARMCVVTVQLRIEVHKLRVHVPFQWCWAGLSLTCMLDLLNARSLGWSGPSEHSGVWNVPYVATVWNLQKKYPLFIGLWYSFLWVCQAWTTTSKFLSIAKTLICASFQIRIDLWSWHGQGVPCQPAALRSCCSDSSPIMIKII
jgi:hypothetical protein